MGFKEVFESFPVPGVQFIHKLGRGLFHLLHVNRFPHCNRQQMTRATSMHHSATRMHSFILHFHSFSFIPLEVLDWCEVYVNSHLHQFFHTILLLSHARTCTLLPFNLSSRLETSKPPTDSKDGLFEGHHVQTDGSPIENWKRNSEDFSNQPLKASDPGSFRPVQQLEELFFTKAVDWNYRSPFAKKSEVTVK